MKIFYTIILIIFSISILFSQKRELKVVTLDWPPYVSKNIPNNGFTYEIADSIFTQMGYDLNLEFYPRNRCILMMKTGEADLLLSLYYSKEREEFIVYPDPIYEVELVFFEKSNRNISYSKLEDLKDYTIGVTKGFVHTPEFDSAPYLNKEEVVMPYLNIAKLINDRVDLIVGERKALQYLLTKNYPDKAEEIKIVEKPLAKINLYIGINKQNVEAEKIKTQFNYHLKKLKESGGYQEILEKFMKE